MATAWPWPQYGQNSASLGMDLPQLVQNLVSCMEKTSLYYVCCQLFASSGVDGSGGERCPEPRLSFIILRTDGKVNCKTSGEMETGQLTSLNGL